MASDLKKLVELIETLENNLENLDPASKEYSDVVDNLNVLYKLKLEYERVANEHAARTKEIENESINREQQREEQHIDRKVRIIIAGAELFVPIGFYTMFMVMGFHFEKTGTICSDIFRNCIKNFRPRL